MSRKAATAGSPPPGSARRRLQRARRDLEQAHALYRAGEMDAARERLRRALRVVPGHVDAWHLLGVIEHIRGDSAEAVRQLQRAAGLAPENADILNSLGNVLRESGQLEDAAKTYRRALELRPDHIAARANLANTLAAGGLLSEALSLCDQVLARRHEHPQALRLRANTLLRQGRLNEAIPAFRRALEVAPDPATHSDLLLALNSHDGIDRQALYAEHLVWAGQHAPPPGSPASVDADPARRLRVGFVSRDFGRHPVSYFLAPVWAALDRERMEVVAYCDNPDPDTMTEHLRSLADAWHQSHTWSHQRLAETIAEHRVDVLVDLAGHTSNNRLPLFARRAAPLQVAWLGYPNTTGLATMDYRITDALCDPEGDADRLHTETLLRLPEGFLRYSPPAAAPEPRPRTGGGLVLGSFNHLRKLSDTTVRLWARALDALPGSRLMLKAHGLYDEGARSAVVARFEAAGVPSERLIVRQPTKTLADHLGAYHDVDIALDTFPYHGTTTTFDALWMGVPVVSLTGDRHAARVGLGILTRAGLGHLAASDERGFIDAVVKLADDAAVRSALRCTLRQRLVETGLTDGAPLARSLEQALRTAWRRWCAAVRA